MRDMEAAQDEAIDAAIDMTGSANNVAVKLVEEACWGSALSADGDAGSHLDEGTRDLDRHPVDKRIDGLDASLKIILDKLTAMKGTAGGSTRAEGSAKGGKVRR